jgi:hypothetical protein
MIKIRLPGGDSLRLSPLLDPSSDNIGRDLQPFLRSRSMAHETGSSALALLKVIQSLVMSENIVSL